MIIISTHVHTLVHNYPPFSISTHVEVIIILKTKDFGKTIDKVLNSSSIYNEKYGLSKTETDIKVSLCAALRKIMSIIEGGYYIHIM